MFISWPANAMAHYTSELPRISSKVSGNTKNDVVEGFTKRYGVHTLVWYEIHSTMESAITREKAIKGWQRRWKLELIECINPDWHDMSEELA